MRYSDHSSMVLLKSTIVNTLSGLTMVASLIGAATTQSDVNKSLYLAMASMQAISVVVTSNDVEDAELAHNDVLDIEAQARVNSLTERLVYGKQDYTPQLWAMVMSQLEQGTAIEDIYPLLSTDEQEAKRLMSHLESKYAKVR